MDPAAFDTNLYDIYMVLLLDYTVKMYHKMIYSNDIWEEGWPICCRSQLWVVGASFVDFLLRGLLKQTWRLPFPSVQVLIQSAVRQRCRTHVISASIRSSWTCGLHWASLVRWSLAISLLPCVYCFNTYGFCLVAASVSVSSRWFQTELSPPEGPKKSCSV